MNTTPDPRGREQHASLNYDVIEQISTILRRKGMCQRDLAQLMGKRESEISKWMRGTHNFTLSTIAGIQEALGEKILDTPLNFTRAIARTTASQ